MKVTPIIDGTEKVTNCAFYCEGCSVMHRVMVNSADWFDTSNFNGDLERPTFYPSILETKPHHPEKGDICHSFITDGKIKFLDDCTHHLAGQTLDLPDLANNKMS